MRSHLSRASVWPAAGLLLLAALVATDLLTGRQVNGVYGAGAVLAAIRTDARRTGAVAAVALVASLASGVWNDNVGSVDWSVRFASCALLCGLAVAVAGANHRRQRQLAETTALAQRVLDALAVELTGARTVREVVDGFVGHAVATLGASSAMVLTLDSDDVLRTVSWHGRGGDGADQYREIPLAADLPGPLAVRQRTDVHYRSVDEIVAAFPDLAGYYTEDRSLHLLPLHRGETTLGLLALTFPPALFRPAQDGFLHSLAGALTSAVQRAVELEADDAATQRTVLLAEASSTLSRSLSLQTTLDEVCRLLVPRFADWCSVQLLRDGQLETVAVQHRDPDTTAWAWSMRCAFPTRMDAAQGAAAVLRTGRSELYPFISADQVERAATGEEHLAVLRRLGLTSAVIAPLRDRGGTVVGVVALIHAESGRRYGEEDLAFLEEIADRAAVALDTATTFEHQTERLAEVTLVAEAAQRAILAPPPQRSGPLTLSARYLSAATEAQVGGDLYEVVPSATSSRLLVGDVRGKGLGAVRTATVVLGAFRSAAADTDDVAAIARDVDRRIVPYLADAEDFVTAVVVAVEHDGCFRVASCGHPPPYRLRPDGRVEALAVEPSRPLGLGAEPVVAEGRLCAGERLLLFTDGMLEARTPDGDFVDPAPFLPAVGAAAFDTALDPLLASLREAAGHALDDDLALLLVGYDPAG
ncbi:PP2C family protein-serine/threonine phosphatase [Nocardioides perillae]|uniref:Serine phosphatase RsbU (Regulator of sigma subunit) n=1 Tax=Nocardioides perillae TaxID=1119534 RepID=A0A7Y9RSX2_9ACTN|nr:GAF domain-containing SpoIIE family protein phosphatase [Nocardioides perillae]NYG54631.1 serine phosphatase RsbU (regulator of sigma subunit) [Nocardioides perillae]